MKEKPSDNPIQTTKPSSLKKRTLIGGIVIFGVVVGLVLFTQFSARSSSSLQEGWTSYPGAVSALAVDKHGRVWAACQFYCASNSLRLYQDGIKPTEFPIPIELIEPRGISSLAIDGQDGIWVGSWNGVIGRLDSNHQWKIYTPENFTPEKREPVWDIVIDGQGLAWVRSNIGLGVIDSTKNGKTYTFTNLGLPDNNINAITMDKMGQVWVDNGGLRVLEPGGNWTKMFESTDCKKKPFPCSVGSAFAFDRQGQMWRGSNKGVIVFGLDGTWQEYTLGNTKVVNDISSILVDNRGRVWVGARQGLFRFDPDTGWTTYNTGNSPMSDDGVNALAIDGQGRVWIGTDAGLSVLDNEAALEPNKLQTHSILLSAIIPSAGLGLLLIIGLMIAFNRPGALETTTIRDLFIGFFGWFAINILIWGGLDAIGQLMGPASLILVYILWMTPVLNLIVLIVLNQKRRWVAFGGLLALIVNSIETLLLAPPVTDSYYHSPIFDIVLMIPFFLKNAGF